MRFYTYVSYTAAPSLSAYCYFSDNLCLADVMFALPENSFLRSNILVTAGYRFCFGTSDISFLVTQKLSRCGEKIAISTFYSCQLEKF